MKKILSIMAICLCIFCFSEAELKFYAEANGELIAEEKFAEGVTKSFQKDYQGSILKFSEAIELNPKYAAAYKYRGLVYCKLKNYEQAIDDFTKAIEVASYDYAAAYYARGNIYYHLKNYEQAIDDFTKAIKIYDNHMDIVHALNPSLASLYCCRGMAYIGQKKYEQAADDFTKAIEFDRKHEISEVAYCYRGFVKNELKNYSQAIKDYNKAVELNPNFADVYYWRGLCFQSMGENSKAEKDFAKAKQLGRDG